MKRWLASLLLVGWLCIGQAFAQAVVPVQMRNADLTTTSTQNLISTQNTFTAPRTLTLPGAGALSSYYIQFADTANAINGANTLTIRMADGGLINGASTLVLTSAGAYAFIVPNGSGYYASVVAAATGGTPGGTNGQVQYNNAGAFGGFTVSSDATLVASTGVLTLTTVNSNIGSFGSAVNCTTYTVNGKGLITAAFQTACTPAVGSITGFATGIATWLATPSSANLRAALTDESGTGAAYFQGGDLGTPSAGVATNITALNATQLTTGTVPAARLPNPSGASLGGIQSLTCAANQWLNTISTTGVPSCAQPAFSNLSGSASAVQETAGLDALTTCTTQGAVLYRNSSTWVCLGPGTSGQVLQSGGPAANPSWLTASGTGTVQQVIIAGTAGNIAVSGTCTITVTGTCTVDLAAARKTATTFQTLTSGTGATYTPTSGNVLSIDVRCVGSGGGGAGVTNGSPGSLITGTVGGNTTFNSIVANGGSPGGGTAGAPNTTVAGGAGGTGGTGTATTRYPGGSGGAGGTYTTGIVPTLGGNSIFAGNTASASSGSANGISGAANSGQGGSGSAGGSTNFNVGPSGGGGEGFYVHLPATTYTYTITAGGAGGVGANFTGGTGGSGRCDVIENYNVL